VQEFLLPVGAGGSITEFTAGATLGTFGAAQTFASGLNNPTGLAFGARGNLFAANFNDNSITAFAFNSTAGTFGAGTTFATGLSQPGFLAFGPSIPPAVPEVPTTGSFGLLLAPGLGGLVIRREAQENG